VGGSLNPSLPSDRPLSHSGIFFGLPGVLAVCQPIPLRCRTRSPAKTIAVSILSGCQRRRANMQGNQLGYLFSRLIESALVRSKKVAKFGRGWSNLWTSFPADRWSWFIRKKLECVFAMVTTLGRLGLPFGADQNLDTAALDFLEGIPAENLAHEWRPSNSGLL